MTRQYNTESYLLSVADDHKDKHDYSRAIYTKAKEKIEIICKTHGQSFWQEALAHRRGAGCPICAHERKGGTQRTTQLEFISRSEALGDNCDHSKVVYKNSITKVEIVCNVEGHGSFNMIPMNRLKGQRCPKCARITSAAKCTKTQEQFIEQCLQHPRIEELDVTDTVYVNDKAKVAIRCKKHGVFHMQATNFLQGQSCPSCSQSGYRHKLPGYLYILSDGLTTKVGITNRKPDLRAKEIVRSGGPKLDIISSHYFQDGSLARNLELACHEYLTTHYKPVEAVFDGSTECFQSVDIAALLSFVTPLATENPSSTTPESE